MRISAPLLIFLFAASCGASDARSSKGSDAKADDLASKKLEGGPPVPSPASEPKPVVVAQLAPSQIDGLLDAVATSKDAAARHNAAFRAWTKSSATGKMLKAAQRDERAAVETIAKEYKLDAACFQPWVEGDPEVRKRCAESRKLWGISPRGEVISLR